MHYYMQVRLCSIDICINGFPLSRASMHYLSEAFFVAYFHLDWDLLFIMVLINNVKIDFFWAVPFVFHYIYDFLIFLRKYFVIFFVKKQNRKCPFRCKSFLALCQTAYALQLNATRCIFLQLYSSRVPS